jgi:hypothetical protein
MALFINDGNINFNGNWQTTANADTLHASATVIINSTVRYTKQWVGVSTNVCKGVGIYIITVATAETITAQLQKNANADGSGAWGNATGDSAGSVSTTLVITGTGQVLTYYYFKFADVHTEANGSGAGNYRVAFTGSSAASSTTARADATTTTAIGKFEVLNATGTLAAASTAYICGITQASTDNPTAATVTMNINDTANAYGQIDIWTGGSLTYGVTAATTYSLRLGGNLNVAHLISAQLQFLCQEIQ